MGTVDDHPSVTELATLERCPWRCHEGQVPAARTDLRYPAVAAAESKKASTGRQPGASYEPSPLSSTSVPAGFDSSAALGRESSRR